MATKKSMFTPHMPDGRTPEQCISELRQFFTDNKEYYMDEMRVIDLIDIARMQLLALITRPKMERCPFAKLAERASFIHCE